MEMAVVDAGPVSANFSANGYRTDAQPIAEGAFQRHSEPCCELVRRSELAAAEAAE